MTEKYIMCSLEDERSRKLGEAISNPTCKKIINMLAEREASAAELSKELGLPFNTLDYSLKKLIDAGIIEKSKHFWSVKGKKIPTYRVVNKVIVIQPKKTSNVYSKLKNISLMVGISAILTVLIAWLTRNPYSISNFNLTLVEDGLKASEGVQAAAPLTISSSNLAFSLLSVPAWAWFGIGALIVMIVFLIWNWKKM